MRLRAPSPQSRALLAALLDRPLDWRHGYDLARQAGLGSGTLYPILIRLHERGLLDAKWVPADQPGRPPRHAYRLTATGLAYARTAAEPAQTQTRKQPWVPA